jgi:hypothetical protein
VVHAHGGDFVLHADRRYNAAEQARNAFQTRPICFKVFERHSTIFLTIFREH